MYNISTLKLTIIKCKELFNNVLGSSLCVYMFQLKPFEGGHDAEVAHGENEFDTLGLEATVQTH